MSTNSDAEYPVPSRRKQGMNKGFSTQPLPIYSAGCMQSVLELTLALKVAPDTAVVKKNI